MNINRWGLMRRQRLSEDRRELAMISDDAIERLRDAMHKYPADAHETYFTANGANYRIRIERIPGDDSSVRRKGESNANT